MATHALTADTLISTLMPSGGGSLASGDTIQLAGYSLIVDSDAVDYPVTIANSGTDANLELRDLGRIKLDATLPSNVHPWIAPDNPLPVSAEPGIDGDPYRTNLTANARAEIQLAGNFSLGGGAASLPTDTRTGNFYARAVSYPTASTVVFDRDLPLHVGDVLYRMSQFGANQWSFSVVGRDEQTGAWIVDGSYPTTDGGELFGVLAGGVAIRVASSMAKDLLTADANGGTLNVFHAATSFKMCGDIVNLFFDKFAECGHPGVNLNRVNTNGWGFGKYGRYEFGKIIAPELCCTDDWHSFLVAQDAAIFRPLWNYNLGFDSSKVILHRGEIGRAYVAVPRNRLDISLVLENVGAPIGFEQGIFGVVHLKNCNIPNAPSGDVIFGPNGSVTLQGDKSFYHAPATAADVTWRYADRAVPPGATLRLRCAWRREGSVATRASVAVTDPATWWPQLWPLGADALASVEFTGGTADWRSELLTWRNTGTEAVQVRVWECVTVTAAGGYLKVEEVKGGQL